MKFEKFIKDIEGFLAEGYSWSDISMIYNLEFQNATLRRIFLNKKCHPKSLKIIEKFSGEYNLSSLKMLKKNKVKFNFDSILQGE